MSTFISTHTFVIHASVKFTVIHNRLESTDKYIWPNFDSALINFFCWTTRLTHFYLLLSKCSTRLDLKDHFRDLSTTSQDFDPARWLWSSSKIVPLNRKHMNKTSCPFMSVFWEKTMLSPGIDFLPKFIHADLLIRFSASLCFLWPDSTLHNSSILYIFY